MGVGDFSGLLGRLEHHDYQKILVRNLDEPNFWYDGHRSPQPTGIRQAIRDNYREVGRIKSVQGERRFLLVSYEPLLWPGTRYGFEEITVLVPKTVTGPERSGFGRISTGAKIMRSIPRPMETDRSLRVCSYEDRPEAMDGLILMGESLCRVDPGVSLHLTVPDAPASVRNWAERRPEVMLCTSPPNGASGWDVKPLLLLQELNAGRNEAIWLDSDTIVIRPISSLLKEFPRDTLIVSEEWDQHEPIPVTHLWGMSSARPVWPTNTSFVRATPAHRPLLERWLQMTHDPALPRGADAPLYTPPIPPCQRSGAPERPARKRRIWTGVL